MVLVVNACVEDFRMKKREGFVLYLDLGKAYDMMSGIP